MKDRGNERRLSVRRQKEKEARPGLFRSWNELAPWLLLVGFLIGWAISEFV